MAGIFTSMCIFHTITDLYYRDAVIYVPKKGVADADSEAHTQTLKYIKNIYKVKII